MSFAIAKKRLPVICFGRDPEVDSRYTAGPISGSLNMTGFIQNWWDINLKLCTRIEKISNLYSTRHPHLYEYAYYFNKHINVALALNKADRFWIFN